MAAAAKPQQKQAPPQTTNSNSKTPGDASSLADKATAVAASDAAVNSAAAVGGTTAAAASAALPRAVETGPTPLRHLNSTTAKLATWDVAIANAHVEEYTYTWDNKARTGKVFRCMLVFVHDTSQYCMGEVRKEKGSPANTCEVALEKFHDGSKFRISAVELNIKSKAEYNSATVKHTVDLQKTTTSKLLADAVHRPPQPVVTCAECVAFKSVQAFDITALIDTVSEPRSVSGSPA